MLSHIPYIDDIITDKQEAQLWNDLKARVSGRYPRLECGHEGVHQRLALLLYRQERARRVEAGCEGLRRSVSFVIWPSRIFFRVALGDAPRPRVVPEQRVRGQLGGDVRRRSRSYQHCPN